MNTVVYLANQQIQVVNGTVGEKKIAVNDYYIADAPEGSIINGIVMDSDSFIDFFMDFWKAHKLPTKDVILVINSSKFVGQVIEVPPMKDVKTLEFIDREFTDIKKDDETIYGFVPLASTDSKMNRIYAESISPDLIKDYIDLFSAMGISLKAIYSGESSLIGLTDMTVGKQFKTFVLEIADGMNLTTLLWVDGGFYYFNSVRCFHDQGTEDYARDVARSVSQITQFMMAHQIEHDIECVVMAGVSGADMGLYQMAIQNQGINVPIRLFDGSGIAKNSNDIQNYLHAASGLVLNGKCQNFLNQYKGKGKKGGIKLGKTFILIASITLLMFVALAVSIFFRIKTKQRLKEAEDFNKDINVMLDVAKYDGLSEECGFLYRELAAIKEIDENIYTYPVCNNKILLTFAKCAGNYAHIEFDSFNAIEGNASVSASAVSVDDINKFIKALNEDKTFSNVDYTGYEWNESDGVWNINVTCTLSESAGRNGVE